MNATEYMSARNKVFVGLERKSSHLPKTYTAQEMRDLGRQLKELKQAAKDLFKEPPTDDLEMLTKMYADLVSAECERLDAGYKQAEDRVKELQGKSYIDHLTAEESATIDSLAARYVHEFNNLVKGNAPQFQQFMNKVLSDRLGALALLRFPANMIADSDTHTDGKIPRQYISQALEKSKSPEALAFEKENAAAIQQANAAQVLTWSEGRQMRMIRDSSLNQADSGFFFNT